VSENTIPKPWDNEIQVRPSENDDNKGGLTAFCTCGGYEQEYPARADTLDMAAEAAGHYRSHPLKPLSAVQIGDADETVIMVIDVPGHGEVEHVHMTLSVTKAVFDDNIALAKFLGPIGSPIHFEAEQRRRYAEEHEGHMALHMLSHARGVNEVRDIENIAESIARNTQGFLDFIRGNNLSGMAAPGVALFEDQGDIDRQMEGNTP
jgi:hypothetical protein